MNLWRFLKVASRCGFESSRWTFYFIQGCSFA